MTPWSNISDLIELVNLDGDRRDELHALLSQFSALPEKDEDGLRSSVSAKVFQLIFGQNAFTQDSDGFNTQRQVPW